MRLEYPDCVSVEIIGSDNAPRRAKEFFALADKKTYIYDKN
jgi:phosphoribosylaminoimidazole carboxylase (NCAIR synthetase)